MKTNTVERTCEVNTTGDIRAAKIADSPAMFDILYNRLYTNKELAIVRELITNAWDSHCRAGSAMTPIDVHLPTSLEPWLTIRDYGVGLSPEAIDMLFDYGSTDKNHSNDEIGGFGLGSKSPFCYTDQFSVISVKDGHRHVFTAFLREDGRPGSTHWFSEATDEPTGLEVSVNIDNTMAHGRFEGALQRLWPYLPTAPHVNKKSFEPPEQEHLFDVDGLDAPIQRAVLRKQDYHEADVRFIQGIVPYPVSFHELDIPHNSLIQHLRRGSSAYDVWLDVGTLEITASRESLSLSDTTKAEARRILEEVANKMAEQIQTEMRSAKSWYDWVTPANFLPASERVVPTSVKPYVDRIEHTFNGDFGKPLLTAHLHQFTHQVARYQREQGRKRNSSSRVRRCKLDGLSRKELDKSQLYVRPKVGWPIREFLEGHLQREGERIVLFTGDYAETRQWLDELGVPHELHELPYIKPKQAERSRSRGESTRYETGRQNLTANEIIEEYGDHVLINTETPWALRNTLNGLRRLGILEGPPVLAVCIPETHTRVLRRLAKRTQGFVEHPGQLARHVNHTHAQQLINGQLAQTLVNVRWAYSVQRILKDLDDGDTILHEYRDAVNKTVELANPGCWVGGGYLEDHRVRELVNFLVRHFHVSLTGQEALVRHVLDAADRRIRSCDIRLRQQLPGLAAQLNRPATSCEGQLNDLVRDFTTLLSAKE